MYKRPLGTVVLTIFGIVNGFFLLFVGVSSHDIFSLLVGTCCIVLSTALLTLQDWVRRVFISCSFVFLLLNYVPIFVATFTIDPFYGIGILFYFPIALFAFCSIIYLKGERAKKQFKGYSKLSDEDAHLGRIIFWRTYFCFLIFLAALSAIDASALRPGKIPDLIAMILALIGLFGFAWQRKISHPLFWKIFSLIYLIWNIYFEFVFQIPSYSSSPRYGNFSIFMEHVLAQVKIVPLIIALYLYKPKDAPRR